MSPPRWLFSPQNWFPFGDLFAFEDTLVLDQSVILGRIWFMDVDTSGSMLITDMSSNLAHLFASTGQHLVSYNMDTCLPTDFGLDVWSARFADNDRIILSELGGGAMVMFDRSGTCIAAKRLDEGFLSFCTAGDSIFTFRGVQSSTSTMGVYSMNLELVREMLLETPELPRLNQDFQGIAGEI